MEYFRVKNFEKFQFHKRENPPWIRLYCDILNDYSFSLMTDSAKSLLPFVWIIASKCRNRVPFDCDWVKNRIGLKRKPNLKELVKYGFIEIIDTDTKSRAQKVEAREETDEQRTAETEQQTLYRENPRARHGPDRPEKKPPPDESRGECESGGDFALAKKMRDRFFERDSKFSGGKNLDSWARVIRRMRELDGYTRQEIWDMFEWANADPFWSPRVLSPSKLRKHEDAIRARMRIAAGRGRNKNHLAEVDREFESADTS